MPTRTLRTPLHPLDDVTFGKWPFEKMSGGLGKNSELLPRCCKIAALYFLSSVLAFVLAFQEGVEETAFFALIKLRRNNQDSVKKEKS